MTEPLFIAELNECPLCGVEWHYVGKDGQTLSHLIAIYSWERDRTVAWRCPGCSHEWARSAREPDPGQLRTTDIEVRSRPEG